jgi:hypothetical protein
MNLERELKQALRRQNPPAGFDQRVLRRIVADPIVRPTAPSPRPWTRLALPIAASLAVAIGAGYYARQYENHQQRVQAAQAAHNVVLALQIASDKVSAVQVKVQEITRHDRQIQD